MQFVADGPDIPQEVWSALEDDKLVIVCGAGISRPAGLPSFKQLVDKVYDEVHDKKSETEKVEYDNENYDQVLGLLESKGRVKAESIRKAVRKVLATPPNPDLATHRALLQLGTRRDGTLRLVTTNFDRLFYETDNSIRITQAPTLPVPKPHKWNSLVHLHGIIDEDDPDSLHLVLTSADFGNAYLVERWASRFIVELFHNFKVLFVGYSVEDRVMRYLIDAIATERKQDSRIQQAYALAEIDHDGQEATLKKWEAKNITPILYKNDQSNHEKLHLTLSRWADAWSGGLNSKIEVVKKLGPRLASTLGPEEISQFCWAIGDLSGVGARALAGLGTKAPIEWIYELEKKDLLSCPAVHADQASIPIVSQSPYFSSLPSIDQVRWHIINWLTEHIANSEFAKWTTSTGAHIHPSFLQRLRWKLTNDGTVPDALRKVWMAICVSSATFGERRINRDYVLDSIKLGSWSPSLRVELIDILTPYLHIKPSWSLFENADADLNEKKEVSISSILSFDVNLFAGEWLDLMLEELKKHQDWRMIIGDIAFELPNLLRSAMDLHAMLDAASNEIDYSYIHHPSIEPHPQNHGFEQWCELIELNRQAFETLMNKDIDIAKKLVSIWEAIPYPIFRRLTLYAARQANAVDAESFFRLIEKQPRLWIWPTETQVELFRALPVLWSSLNQRNRNKLAALLVEGPQRQDYPDDIEDDDWLWLQDRLIWDRLKRLEQSGCHLNKKTTEKLRKIELANPNFALRGKDRDDFPTWMESSDGHPSDFTYAEFSKFSDDETAEKLMTHDSNRKGLLGHWRLRASEEPLFALNVLKILVEKNYSGPEVWANTFSALARPSDVDFELLRKKTVEVLERVPAVVMTDREALAFASRSIGLLGKGVDEALRPRLLDTWDRLLELSFKIPQEASDELVASAINHPTGVLTEGLFEILRSEELVTGQGIPDDVKLRLKRIIAAKEAALGKVIVASRLALLYQLDSEWTIENVLPLFKWSTEEEAIGAWQGYLGSPWINPSLWRAIHVDFIDCFDHIDKLQKFTKNLIDILINVYVVVGEDVPFQTMTECLRITSEQGRLGEVAQLLRAKLVGRGAQAQILWRDRIGPLLVNSWPKRETSTVETVSENLAWGAALTGDAFPEAVDCVTELLGPIHRGRRVLGIFAKHGLAEKFPSSLLTLLNKITPDDAPPHFGDLRNLLKSTVEADYKLSDTTQYKRLDEIATKANL